MEVGELWRFPIKSLQGERLREANVTERGLAGDRGWAIRDRATGFVLTARREPALLFGGAEVDDAARTVAVRLPDGQLTDRAADLSSWLGRDVELVSAADGASATYEISARADEAEAEGPWVTWTGPERSFHDSTRAAVTLVSRASLEGHDVRRFRMNLVLDDVDEIDHLVGQRVRLGTAVVDVVKEVDRCVMTTRPQPGGIERDLEVLRWIARERAGNLGVGGLVVTPGVVRLGDRVEVLA